VQQTQADLHFHFKNWFSSLRLRLIGRYDETTRDQLSLAPRFDEAARVVEETLKSRGVSWESLALDWAAHWGRDRTADLAASLSPAEAGVARDLSRVRDVAQRGGGEPSEPIRQLLLLYFREIWSAGSGSGRGAIPDVRRAMPESLLDLHLFMVHLLERSPTCRSLRDDLWDNVMSKAFGCEGVEQVDGGSRQDPRPTRSTRLDLRPASSPAWTWRSPDPSLPSHRQGEWANSPDGISAGEDLGDGWRFISASVRGRGHKQDALFCDDSGRFLRVGAWHVLLASDGAGSAKFSRVGSQLACDAAAHRFERELLKCDVSGLELSEADLKPIQDSRGSDARLSGVISAIQQAFGDAQASIADWVAKRNHADPDISAERSYIDRVTRGTEAEVRRRDPGASQDAPLLILDSDLHCTLLACLVASVPFRRADGTTSAIVLAVTCAIGDGMIVAFRQSGLPHPALMLMAPDTGQFAGQTQFLTERTAQPESVSARVHVSFLGAREDLVAVIAMSDGVADDYYDGLVGMERLYCDLVMNELLRCDAPSGDVDQARAAAEEALRARAANAASRLSDLASEFPSPLQPADEFRKKQLQKSLVEQSAQRTLADLVRQETLLARLPDGAQPTSVAVKYAAIYLEALAMKPSELLAKPAWLRAIAQCDPSSVTIPLHAPDRSSSCRQAADGLRRWMDAYIVKGSFDDRTMVVLDAGAMA
jgi:hypothetical protein